MNRRAAPETRARAFDAALALAEFKPLPFLYRQSGGCQALVGIAPLDAAVWADQAHQALGEYAIQSRDEVVGFHAHVQEASEHVYYVVGMHGCEHQMAGKGRLDGDLGCFGVADLTHHDLVRIVAQDRAQPARERQPFLFVDGDLRDPVQLVFDRVFDGDDLVFVALDLAQRRVQRGRLARASRAGHQHHPVRFPDVAPEALLVRCAESDHVQGQLLELLAHGLLVQDAQHRVLAEHGGHDRHAEVNLPPLVAHPEAAVLGHAPLGDVEVAHHLDARQDGLVPVLGDRGHGVVQDAIDAVLDRHVRVAGLDVDVAGPPLEGVEHGRVDQLDHWRYAAGLGELVDRQGLVRILRRAHVQGEFFGDFLQHSLGLLGLVQQVVDLPQGGYGDPQLLAQQRRNLVEFGQAPGV